MAINTEAIDWLEISKEGDVELNERTLSDEKLAFSVAWASKSAYERGLGFEAAGDRDGAIQNFVHATHIGQFIARIYEADPESNFLNKPE